MNPVTRSCGARSLAIALALMPAAAAAQQSTRGTTKSNAPAALGIHGFSVVLVVGSLTGTTTPAANEGVPDAAKKALADMKDFLPYKRYQLLDAAWMLCCASARSGVSGLVRGPDDRDYRYQVDPIGVSDAKLDVRFTIREMAESTATRTSNRTALHPAELERSRQMAEAIHEREEAERQLAAAQALRRKDLISVRELEAKEIRSRQAEARVRDMRTLTSTSVQGSAGQNVIDSTFSISSGETVVVGTSRLNGDRALIAVLTAARKTTARIPDH